MAPEKPVIEKEFRFAVVMYGGISLAIYINGVAQELYRMVRATATKEDGSYFVEQPEGTEAIYRELGRRLKARFVLDILSGTSAGGINAIFLAKALANDQAMSDLEEMWIQEGDIHFLINDKTSIKKIPGLKPPHPPRALLNSERIYNRLLTALEKMDKKTPSKVSPFVNEMDLYITSTDLWGLPRPILLTDREAYEKRFRSVFRFHYSTLGEESYWLRPFKPDNNPFLAFVARATCALPAFQPAKLNDAMDLEGQPYSGRSNFGELTKPWRSFLRDYDFEADSFSTRSFGDGGVLDNKPFSYITETLLRRQSDVPVDRRLFYIEPAPEQLDQSDQKMLRDLDPIENLLAQGFNLPRYETIREDLVEIRARNDLIKRTNDILRQIERTRNDIGNWEDAKKDWRSQYLDQMLAEDTLYGTGYAAYHQLRVGEALDHFAAAVARNIGLDEESSSSSMLRQLFEGWRRFRYSTHSTDQLPSENELLYRLDLTWRMRRLIFLSRMIDNMREGIKVFRTDLGTRDLSDAEQYTQEIVRNSVRKKDPKEHAHVWTIPDQGTENQYLNVLSESKSRLNAAFVILRNRGRRLRQRNLVSLPLESQELKADPELIDYVQALQPFLQIKANLVNVLKDQDELERVWEAIERLSLVLVSKPETEHGKSKGYLYDTFRAASIKCQEIFPAVPSESAHVSSEKLAPRESVQGCLKFYYDNFEYYDKITFPITYATPIGEADVVDVYRISPQDANALFAERPDKRKLAGTKYWNFGAFFKEEWRRNDILWGQLDAAERIITTLPANTIKDTEPFDSTERTGLLVNAWLTILKEKQSLLGVANLKKLEARLGPGWESLANSRELTGAEADTLKARLQAYFESDYTINPKYPFGKALIQLGRSSVVTLLLLWNLARQRFNLSR